MLWFRFALLQVNVLSLVSSFPFLWATFMVHRALVFKLQLKCILFLCAFHWCCLFIFLLNFACIYFDYQSICSNLHWFEFITIPNRKNKLEGMVLHKNRTKSTYLLNKFPYQERPYHGTLCYANWCPIATPYGRPTVTFWGCNVL